MLLVLHFIKQDIQLKILVKIFKEQKID